MTIAQRMPKFFATMVAVFDGDADIAAQIIKELEEFGVEFAEQDCVSLGAAFDWRQSPQGQEYWDMMDEKAEQVLGEDYRLPDFKECGCPACQMTVKLGGTIDAIMVVGTLGMMVEIMPEPMIKDLVARAKEERLEAQAQRKKQAH